SKPDFALTCSRGGAEKSHMPSSARLLVGRIAATPSSVAMAGGEGSGRFIQQEAQRGPECQWQHGVRTETSSDLRTGRAGTGRSPPQVLPNFFQARNGVRRPTTCEAEPAVRARTAL